MEFLQSETIFYIALFVAGAVGNLARQLRSDDVYRLRIWFGRSLSAGIFGGGGCACWLGSASGDGHSLSAWAFVFASGIIGYYFVDLEGRVLEPALTALCKRFPWIKKDQGDGK